MKRILWPLFCLLLLALPANGQGWSMTVWFQQTIAVQAARLDQFPQVQGDDTNIRGYIDQTWLWQDTTNEWMLGLNGWGFECGQFNFAAVDVRLNAFVVDGTPLLERHARPDVAGSAGLSGWCPNFIPLYSGVHMDVPLGQLLPGTYYLRLRFWNSVGHSYETNIVPVTVQ